MNLRKLRKLKAETLNLAPPARLLVKAVNLPQEGLLVRPFGFERLQRLFQPEFDVVDLLGGAAAGLRREGVIQEARDLEGRKGGKNSASFVG